MVVKIPDEIKYIVPILIILLICQWIFMNYAYSLGLRTGFNEGYSQGFEDGRIIVPLIKPREDYKEYS